MRAADHTPGAPPVKVESLFWKMLDKPGSPVKIGDWEMEVHAPFPNDLFPFPTSLAHSGTSEVYFL